MDTKISMVSTRKLKWLVSYESIKRTFTIYYLPYALVYHEWKFPKTTILQNNINMMRAYSETYHTYHVSQKYYNFI